MSRYLTFFLILISGYCFGQKTLVTEKQFYSVGSFQFLQDNKYWIFDSKIGYVNLDNQNWNELQTDDILGTFSDVAVISDKIYLLGNRYIDSIKDRKGFFVCIDTKGNTLINLSFNALPISNYKANNPKIFLSDSYVYFEAFDSIGKKCLYSSDGTNSTAYAYRKDENLIDIYESNGQVSFITWDSVTFNLNRFSDDFIISKEVPSYVPQLVNILFSTTTHIYFGAKSDSLYKYDMWSFDLVTETYTRLTKEISIAHHYEVFEGQYLSFPERLKYNQQDAGSVGKLNDSSSAKTLATYSASGKTSILKHFANNFVLCYNDETGYELAHYSDDKLNLDDVNKGPGSSILAPLEYFIGPIIYSDSLYVVMTNGNDRDQYLYQLHSDGRKKCKTKLETADTYFHPFVYKNSFYWWTTSDIGQSNKGNLWSKSFEKEELQPPVRSNSTEWYRQIAVRGKLSLQMSSGNLLPIKTLITKNKEVVTLLYSTYSYWKDQTYFDQVNYDSTKRGGNNIIIKYDSNGGRLWTSSFGGFRGSVNFKHSSNIALTAAGDIIAIGDVFQGAFWEGEREDFGGSIVKRYIIKIDGQTGKILWKKVFNPTRYTNPLRFEELVLDPNDNIYIAALYEDFGLSIAGQSIFGDKSTMNALLKFDTIGNLTWMKNMETPWIDKYGRTHILRYNKKTNSILAVQSQDWFNVSSSCKWDSSKVYIQQLDLEGNMMSATSFYSNDMLSLTTGDIDNNGYFHGFGYARGNIKTGDFTFETHYNKGCNQDEGISLKYDLKTSKTQKMSKTTGMRCEPIETHSFGKHNYTLCGFYKQNSSWRNYLVIIKTDLAGRYSGHKILNQRFNDDYVMFNSFDVTDDKIAISGIFATNDTTYGILNSIYTNSSLPNVSLLCINNDNWSTDSTWFVPVETDQSETIADFKIYPNPVNDNVTIALSGSTHSYTDYAIYDLKGAEINRGNLTSDQVQTIKVAYLNPGIFILRCFNGEKSVDVKLIKM